METIGYAYNGYTNTLYTAVCGLANYSYILWVHITLAS